MSTNGQLVFTDVDKITFKGVGNTSNAVVDTVTGKIGVGIDSPDANLHVLGNSYVSTNLELGGTLIMGTVNVSAHHSLEAVTAEGNTTPLTVEFQNTDTSLVASGNVEVGNELTVSGNVFFTSNVTTSVDSNVVVEHKGPHGRGEAKLKKYPEIAFAEGKFDITEIVDGSDQYWDGPSTVFQGGYSLKSSQHSTDGGGQFGWMAFDGNSESLWKNAEDYDTSGNYDYGYTGIQQRLTDTNSTNHDGDHVIMGSPSALKMAKVTVTCKNSNRRVVNYSVLGSNSSGTTGWTLLDSGTFTAQDVNTATISSHTSYFKYHAFVVRSVTAGANGTRFQINSIDFYGYEEDPPAGDTSIDTTFKSVLNTPQTTRANVYVDAKLSSDFTNQVTGPTPVGTTATHDNTNKYWEMNGQLTSNITVEANTFLEGDQPHAVSVWFNSSNLEANVSNTCVFSIASEEKLDSVNLDLQSNTWHNLTYSYQGEGGSRVTYLDGRKVVEDQAEDTFGAYPPFGMTGFSQGGYVVSASDTFQEYSPYLAFNKLVNTTSDYWFAGDDTGGVGIDGYTGSVGGDHSYIGSDNLGGYTGIWIKLEMPHKLALSYLEFYQVNGSMVYTPRDFYVIGSNDDITWDLIHRETSTAADNTFTSGRAITTNSVNNHNKYKYIAIVVDRTVNDNRLGIGEIKFYGHRENDLVRLPDPTNVLKYPHIAMTGYSQRGYVASSNNEYTPDGRLAWKAYDGIDTDGSTNVDAWMTNDPSWTTATPGEPIGTGDLAPDTFTVGGVNYTGHWNKLELPHKIRVSQIYMSSRMSTRLPYKGVFLGSDDDSSWEVIYSFNNTLTWSAVSGVGQATTITGITNTNSYKYVMLVVQQINGSDDRLWLNQIKYYGTGVDSIPIQIGGGNIDKVANFRVYDKFVEEDQALEIWDAQKEEFGRAKSSMTLQKGRLGLGTEEPEGRLAVADEPDPDAYGLQEFPPKPLAGYKTHIEGHGEFCVTSSSEHEEGAFYGWYAFDKNHQTTSEAVSTWISEYDPISYDSSGNATGNNGVLNGVNGEYLILESPYKIKMSYVLIYPRRHTTSTYSYSLPPKDGKIWGRNTIAEPWTEITSYANLTYGADRVENQYGQKPTRVNINATQYYKYIAFQITATNTSYNGTSNYTSYTNLKELRYFGYREQVTKQSVLHDGQLTLTKNLNVPRIGPALDADNTPRRDRLVVEYNTSTNPTFEGVVRDTSGRGNDGFMVGSSYNASNKALDLTNSPNATSSAATSYITRTSLGNTESGNFHHSVSLWFKLSSAPSSAWRTIFEIGPHPRTNTKDIGLYVTSNSSNWLGFASGGSTLYGGGAPTGVGVGTYYHIVIVYDGAKKYIYVDGTRSNSGTYSSFNGAQNMTLQIGRNNHGNANEGIDGSISNFKMYVGHALTATEVKTLYDMGRCDEGHHVVNFSKTRVGIGLGDGEAPTSTLDVRGTFQGNSPLRFYVLEGVHPSSGSQFVDLPPGCIGSRIVSITGMTFNTNGDGVPFERHSEGQWEVDVYYSTYSSNATYSNKFVLSSQGSSAFGKPWKMFVVTT